MTVTDVAVFDYSQPVFCVKDVENYNYSVKNKEKSAENQRFSTLFWSECS